MPRSARRRWGASESLSHVETPLTRPSSGYPQCRVSLSPHAGRGMPGVLSLKKCSMPQRSGDDGIKSMSARIIDGKAIAAGLRARVGAQVKDLSGRHGLVPGLAVVLVGSEPASETYV